MMNLLAEAVTWPEAFMTICGLFFVSVLVCGRWWAKDNDD